MTQPEVNLEKLAKQIVEAAPSFVNVDYSSENAMMGNKPPDLAFKDFIINKFQQFLNRKNEIHLEDYVQQILNVINNYSNLSNLDIDELRLALKEKIQQLLSEKEKEIKDKFIGNLKFKLKQLLWEDEDIAQLVYSIRNNVAKL